MSEEPREPESNETETDVEGHMFERASEKPVEAVDANEEPDVEGHMFEQPVEMID